MGARLPNIPVPQSSDQKAAINPAKRVEAIDELHFDSVAEWDADKFFKHEETLRALEQRIDLAPLIRAAESGVWQACWKLWYVAKEATYALNNIAEKQPELFHAFARGCFEWPGVISRNAHVSQENQRFLEKLQQGEDLPFVNIPREKKGRTLSFNVLANRLAFKLYTKIETARAGHDYSKIMAEMLGLTLSSWIEAVNVEPFSAKTWRSWAEIAWQIVLDAADGKPELDGTFRPLGESAGNKKPKYCKELHERTINSNVRAKIKARLFEAFELNAKEVVSSSEN
jgi:hypothetical protein